MSSSAEAFMTLVPTLGNCSLRYSSTYVHVGVLRGNAYEFKLTTRGMGSHAGAWEPETPQTNKEVVA